MLRYGLILILALLATPDGLADDRPPLYRVEVIVFTHAGGNPDRHPASTPRRFEGVVDLLEQRALLDDRPAMPPADPLADPDAAAGDPRPMVWVGERQLSAPMQAVWQRLTRSGEYDAVTWRAWYQTAPRNERTRAVLINDDAVIWNETPDPPDEPDQPTVLIEHTQLAGTARFSRRQFFNFSLDLDWRERLQTPAQSNPERASFLVHRLQQGRSIRPGRLEYFDSAWLGAVVLVTPWHDAEPAEDNLE